MYGVQLSEGPAPRIYNSVVRHKNYNKVPHVESGVADYNLQLSDLLDTW